MKKFLFVLILFFVLFIGCAEETGDSTGKAIASPELSKEKPKPAEIPSDAVSECSEQEAQPCVTSEQCQGIQNCVNGSWVSCVDAPDDGCPRDQLCDEKWECQEWTECSKGIQQRNCIDSHECGSSNEKPDTIKLCKA